MSKKPFANLDALMAKRDKAAQEHRKLSAKVKAVQDQERREAAKQARKDDDARKIIAGAIAIKHAAENPDSDFAKTLHWLIMKYTPDHRRHLFDIEALEAADGASASGLGKLFKGQAKS